MYRTRSFPNQISSQGKVFYNSWTPRLGTMIIYVRITESPGSNLCFQTLQQWATYTSLNALENQKQKNIGPHYGGVWTIHLPHLHITKVPHHNTFLNAPFELGSAEPCEISASILSRAPESSSLGDVTRMTWSDDPRAILVSSDSLTSGLIPTAITFRDASCMKKQL